jgi:quinol monooxygenase YgiN
MAVMLIATVPGGDRQQQQRMYDQIGDKLVGQDGFLFHGAGPTEDGWRLYEVWESRDQLDAWLQGSVFPNLPDDAPRPSMDVVPIEVVLRP